MDDVLPTGSRIEDQINDIPLADEDAPEELSDGVDSCHTHSEEKLSELTNASQRYQLDGQSIESIPSVYTNGTDSPGAHHNSMDPDLSPDEMEEKERLIAQVLECQNTLDDLSQRVDSVKEENLKLKSENQVLAQYIENLMSASSVFQSTSPKSKRKSIKK
ncbi:unnamed protein product [Medioppia subpectinata]|uniref:Short coiled-coil protein n=1 Tax=Medioppia subpectinata TaxID=1979941 RepID=A0A7R9KHL0_9ACAR|nr:unnamed protein product [Medioppia subpectinata]CAG2103522.1 unnamed protein product [Medioppia subpectinata]